MLILIDDAHLDQIERLYEKYPYDGVTTNPTILKRAGNSPMEQLKAIRKAIPASSQLHAQVLSTESDQIIKEAHHMLSQLGEKTFIKIPVSREGLKAISVLAKEGVSITATAIYGPLQGFLAAKAGAKYVAPYVNRLNNLCYDGLQVAKDIHTMLKLHSLDCDVVGASFKNSQQVFELCKFGIGSVTAAPDVLDALLDNGITDNAIAAFAQDFEELCGKGKTMLDFK